MKKIICLLVCIFMLFIFIGCGNNANDNTLENYFYIKDTKGESMTYSISIIADKKTGVNYYYFDCGGGGKAISPIYNADGSLVVDEVTKK